MTHHSHFSILHFAFCILLSSCKTVQPISTDVHNDSVRVEYRHDSVYLCRHDSVFVDRWRAGDTVYIATEKWSTRFQDNFVQVHDTITICRDNTEYLVTTEKVTPRWAYYSLAFSLAVILIFAAKIVRKIYL